MNVGICTHLEFLMTTVLLDNGCEAQQDDYEVGLEFDAEFRIRSNEDDGNINEYHEREYEFASKMPQNVSVCKF